MNENRYKAFIQWAEERPAAKVCLCLLNEKLPWILAIIYILLAILCFFVYPVLLINFILRPAICFITVTFIRYLLKFPRPYDVYNFIPLCGYHPGKNRSFPSRHTASATVIALEIFRIWHGLGFLCLMIAFCIGILRVVCGNHFIKDVVAAYGVAFLFYIF